MILHPECPYRPNDPYHLDKGSERRISSSESNAFDDIELRTKDPQTEIIALASQEILNKPEPRKLFRNPRGLPQGRRDAG